MATMMMAARNNRAMPYCGRDCCYVAHRKSKSCKKVYRRTQRRIELTQLRKEISEMVWCDYRGDEN